VHPSNPFKLTIEVLDFAGNSSVPAHVVPATTVLVVVDGSLVITSGGASKTYDIGEEVTLPAGSPVAITNPGTTLATAVATQLGG